MIRKEDIVTIGKFQKTHALKGELNMISDIDSEYFMEGNPLIVENDGILVPFYVESIRPKGTTSYLVKLEGINSEEEASIFVNNEISILKKDAEEWLDDTFEDLGELIGYSVIEDKTRVEIGRVERIDDSTSNILLILTDKDDEQIYIPFNEDLIVEIDDENQVIKMNLPEGLVDLNTKQI